MRSLAFINPRLSTRNVGDLFIEDAVKRILVYDRASSIEVDPRKPITDRHIEAINGCDAAVIVGTNLWYRSLAAPGRWCFTAEQLRRIRRPIVPLGVGTTRHAGEDNGFDDDTRTQLRIIHDSCDVASVRDERTLDAVGELGVRNVQLTGCPTLYRSLAPRWEMRPLADDSDVDAAPAALKFGSQTLTGASLAGALEIRPARARNHLGVTVRKGQRENLRALLRLLDQAGYSYQVAAQQDKDCFLQRGIPWIRPGVSTLYEYALAGYIALVEDSFGAIGCRLHGNMFHLSHGNPAVFLANCSRAQSYCQTYALPYYFCPDHERLSVGQLGEAVERLAEPAEFAAFAKRYAHFYGELRDVLTANGLPHRLAGQASGEQSIRRKAA